MNVSDCYSATRRGVAKVHSKVVALRLLYTVMPITNKKLKVVCFLRASHMLSLSEGNVGVVSFLCYFHLSLAHEKCYHLVTALSYSS